MLDAILPGRRGTRYWIQFSQLQAPQRRKHVELHRHRAAMAEQETAVRVSSLWDLPSDNLTFLECG